jgi:hypothetical protein
MNWFDSEVGPNEGWVSLTKQRWVNSGQRQRAEELELSYKLINRGFRIIYCPSVRIFHKISPEARVEWSRDRYYYRMRNAIYLKYRFDGRFSSCLAVAAGYSVLGVASGYSRQALHALRDSIRMCRKARRFREEKLGAPALAYVRRYDGQFRPGNFAALLSKLRVRESLPRPQRLQARCAIDQGGPDCGLAQTQPKGLARSK